MALRDLILKPGERTFVPAAAAKIEQHFAVSEAAEDWSFSPEAGRLRLTRHSLDSGRAFWTGDFVDYRGLVTILRSADYLRLDAVAGGRCHVRAWRRYYGDRTVSQLCRAFLSHLHGAPA